MNAPRSGSGLREVDGLKAQDAALLLQYRSQKKPLAIADLHGFGVPVAGLEKLAAADCFRSLGLDRRAALWEVKALAKSKALPLFAFADTREQGDEAHVSLARHAALRTCGE